MDQGKSRKSKKNKNLCKICATTVKQKNGIQCSGACQKWMHYACLKYTPGKIQDIKNGYIKITCPCPDCESSGSDEEIICKPLHSGRYCCKKIEAPNKESLECPVSIKLDEKQNCGATQCQMSSPESVIRCQLCSPESITRCQVCSPESAIQGQVCSADCVHPKGVTPQIQPSLINPQQYGEHPREIPINNSEAPGQRKQASCCTCQNAQKWQADSGNKLNKLFSANHSSVQSQPVTQSDNSRCSEAQPTPPSQTTPITQQSYKPYHITSNQLPKNVMPMPKKYFPQGQQVSTQTHKNELDDKKEYKRDQPNEAIPEKTDSYYKPYHITSNQFQQNVMPMPKKSFPQGLRQSRHQVSTQICECAPKNELEDKKAYKRDQSKKASPEQTKSCCCMCHARCKEKSIDKEKDKGQSATNLKEGALYAKMDEMCKTISLLTTQMRQLMCKLLKHTEQNQNT